MQIAQEAGLLLAGDLTDHRDPRRLQPEGTGTLWGEPIRAQFVHAAIMIRPSVRSISPGDITVHGKRPSTLTERVLMSKSDHGKTAPRIHPG